MKDKKTRPSIIEAFNAAIQGIIYTFKYERNMKIHYIIAVAVLIISLRFDLNKFEMMILILSISLVIISEMFNTAIENTVDLVTDKYHYLAKIAKDVAAGGVLISALNAVAVGYLIFYHKKIRSTCYINMYSISLNKCSCSKSIDIYRNSSKRRYAKWTLSFGFCYSYSNYNVN